ncbi:probable sodium/metabolite cotransporter BASS4, chloroplastic [Rhodamnia argentea]|uniref:Probable sodium/metabolite cotransporter BASS4, chloroplastic n=1 Tax=Rhodamnia argentea TaxID=178133 RepID=A0A8B8NVZ3_9MYRT|nr:probable sodium/metabolite cotransporter BASS4, chloroplastic [Rhodamnia argentea]
MAGTLQTLILSPATSKMVLLCPRNMRFSSHGTRLSVCPVKIGPRRSTLRPVRACEASGQVGGNDYAPKTPRKVKAGNPFSKFVADNFLPLALIGGVALGLANPSLGCLADRYYLSKFSTFGIFIISGLTLRSREIGAAAEAWPVGMFGLGSILLFTPYFSKLILQIQLQPQEFVTGLAIFSCMPTTLSSGVALTQLAGGNSALALAMTVISNLLGILIVPFSLSKLIADGVGVTVPTKQLFKSLVLTLLFPLILGKILRESFRGLADFVDNNQKLFSRISAVFLSLVPWIQVSRSRSLLLMVQPEIFLVAIGMGIVLHIFLLAFNAFAIQCLSMVTGGGQSVFGKKENANAALLVASQKTLPVMVAVVEQLGGAFGESGLLVLPCVAAHLIQIIMDSFLVNFWLRKDAASNGLKVA